jgi:hypothetical protein
MAGDGEPHVDLVRVAPIEIGPEDAGGRGERHVSTDPHVVSDAAVKA